MTTNTLPHRLRTYLGGELGNEAADEIERLTAMNDALKWYREPTIEQIAQILAAQGLTIVSAADAEKVKRCDCGWQPIESAPDAQEVLTAGLEYNKGPGMWVSIGYKSHAGTWVFEDDLHYPPTHWQPLPEPPKDASHD